MTAALVRRLIEAKKGGLPRSDLKQVRSFVILILLSGALSLALSEVLGHHFDDEAMLLSHCPIKVHIH